MGRILDSLFVSLISFLVFLTLLLFTDKNPNLCVLLASLSAGCVFIVISFILEKTPRLSFHRRRTRAVKRVRALIYDDAQRAHETVFHLLARRYPIKDACFTGGHLTFTHMNAEEGILHVIQKLKVSPDDILKAWREHGAGTDVQSLVIAIPGRSEADVRVIAYKLTKPEIVILDRIQLMRLMRRYSDTETPSARVRSVHLLRALRGYVTRRRAGRYLVYALLLSLYYLLTGRIIYLFSGLFLLYIAAFSLAQRKEPEKLI